MIRLANAINQYPDRVRYVCNVRDDLGLFAADTFSFIYSNVVLQHIVPARALVYLGEMIRVLAPDGLLVFQLPSHLRPESEQRAVSTPMPAPAYAASVRIESDMPSRVMPGATISLWRPSRTRVTCPGGSRSRDRSDWAIIGCRRPTSC